MPDFLQRLARVLPIACLSAIAFAPASADAQVKVEKSHLHQSEASELLQAVQRDGRNRR